MQKRTITRRIIKTVVGMSASAVVHRALSDKREDDNYVDKTMVAIGSAVIGAMVGDAAGTYVDSKLDELFQVETSEQDTTPDES